MDEQLRNLTRDLETRGPGEVDDLRAVASAYGLELPSDYLGFTRDELICHGQTFTEFLENLAAFRWDEP